MKHAFHLLPLLVTLLLGCDKSDDQVAKDKPKPPVPAAIVPTTQSLIELGHMGVGDLLAVDVGELTGPGSIATFPRQVDQDGTITLPAISKPVTVAGKSKTEIEQSIIKQYREEHIIQSALVTVRRLRVAGTGGPIPGPVAPFDLVRIGVAELTGPNSMTELVTRVDGEGIVSLPYVGGQKIAGLTVQKAEAEISHAYHNANIVAHPMVTVLRLEAAPASGEMTALPDLPTKPVPEMLRWLYEPRSVK
jgi:protein involved in polysaccharide export with SLBB domain